MLPLSSITIVVCILDALFLILFSLLLKKMQVGAALDVLDVFPQVHEFKACPPHMLLRGV